MKKICKFCRKEFEASNNRQIYCSGPHYRTCPVCGKQYEETNVANLTKPPKACSYKCRAERAKQTSLERYGCTAPGNCKAARDKAKATCLSHTGYEYAMQSPEVQKKSRETLLKKYGVDNAGKSRAVVAKRMMAIEERYGTILPFNRPDCYRIQQEKRNYSLKHFAKEINSPKVNEICEFLRSSGVNVELKKHIDEYQYDIYIPETNMLVEVDSTFDKMVPKYYFKDKTKVASENGFRCIHVFDWDNIDILKKNLLPKKKLDVDSMTMYQLNASAVNEFLNENHYAGTRRNQLLCLGLVKDGIIYQIMTFGKPTYSNSHCIQIYRMCTRCGFDIPHGFDKLSDTASLYGLYKIIAYSDLAKNSGLEYEEIGMTKIRETPPRLIWSKGSEYISSAMLSRNKYNLRTSDELIQAGWLPMYDCGQAVYEFE